MNSEGHNPLRRNLSGKLTVAAVPFALVLSSGLHCIVGMLQQAPQAAMRNVGNRRAWASNAESACFSMYTNPRVPNHNI